MTIPKFRAWDKISKKMFPVMMIDFGQSYVMIEEINGLWCERGFDEIELMQSIGLIDENGKEIFEGDIVKDGGEDVGVVVYDKECGAYGLKYKSNVILTFENIDELGDWKGSAVIGNVWENKELLEEVE